MDYYSILGIQKTATSDDIKRAYRKAVKQHHPDTGGDAETFKKINEAYETLRDSEKRNLYDQGPKQSQNNFNFRSRDFNNPEDIFSTFFRQPRQHPMRTPNRDITVEARLDLKDVLLGKSLIMSYNLSTGKTETVTIDIPSGARHGDVVRYQGLGDNANPNMPRGNLHVRISVSKDKNWTREENNIRTLKKIDVFDLILGTDIEVTTPENRTVKVTIPKGTQPGTTFSIKGYGIPNINTRVRGHLYVTVDVKIPQNVDQSILKKIKDLRDEINSIP